MKYKMASLIEEAHQCSDGNLVKMFTALTDKFQEINPKQFMEWGRVLDEHSFYDHGEGLLEISVDECTVDFTSFCAWLVELGERFYHSIQEDPDATSIRHLANLLGTDSKQLLKAPVYAYLKSLGQDQWLRLMYEAPQDGGLPAALQLDAGESDPYGQMEADRSYQTFGGLCLLFYLCTAVRSGIVV